MHSGTGVILLTEEALQCPLMTQSGHERLRIGAVQTDPEPHSAGSKSLL